MGKKTSKSVAKLRSDVQALSEAVWALKEHVRVEVAAESAANGSRKRKSRRLGELERQVHARDGQGMVSTYGAFRLPGQNGTARNVSWQLENASTESLIAEEIESAATQLGAIGHRQRLGLLIALLQQPSSVSDLVRNLDLGTSGAAYHHLNVLQNAGFVVQRERGIFEIAPDRAGCIIGILSALAISTTVEDVPVEAPPAGVASTEA